MIVAPAVFEDGRTIWRLEAEQGDLQPSRPALWIEGIVRPIFPEAEAIWLALALQPFARRRLVVPTIVNERLREQIEKTLGLSVAGQAAERRDKVAQREFRAVLIRDPLDLFVSQLARSPANYAIEVVSSPAGAATASTAWRIVANAGALRRELQPLDRMGELASSIMLAPIHCLRSLCCFHCREEIAGLDPVALSRLVEMAGVNLTLPFAASSVTSLGRHVMSLGIPPIIAFRGLWKRYRMAPEIVAELYRQLAPSLVVSEADRSAVRISEYFAELSPRDTSSGHVFDSFDADFFIALPTAATIQA